MIGLQIVIIVMLIALIVIVCINARCTSNDIRSVRQEVGELQEYLTDRINTNYANSLAAGRKEAEQKGKKQRRVST